mgnify:CR=1 FL=1
MIADAVRRGAYLNPTLHYEWGGMSKRAQQRELEDYRVLSNPDLAYIPRNIADGILGQATADQELLLALREHALDQPPAGGRSQGVRDRIPERARVHPTVCRGRRQDSRRHGYHRGRNAGPEHASRDGDAGRGGPHAHAGAESGDLLVGGTAARQERGRGTAKIGSIRAGNFADLVVVSADPLSDISNTKKIERVMKNGRWVELGYHPEYFTFGPSPPARSWRRTCAPTISSMQPKPRAGRISARARGAGRKRVYDDVLGAGRRDLGQDDIPPSTACWSSTSRPSAVARASPDPSAAQGPRRTSGLSAIARVAVHRLPIRHRTEAPSNTVYQMVLPK